MGDDNWAGLATKGKVKVDPDVAIACASACANLIEALRRYQSAEGSMKMKDDTFGNLDSGDKMVKRFNDKAHDFAQTLGKHEKTLTDLADLFKNAGLAYKNTDEGSAADLKALENFKIPSGGKPSFEVKKKDFEKPEGQSLNVPKPQPGDKGWDPGSVSPEEPKSLNFAALHHLSNSIKPDPPWDVSLIWGEVATDLGTQKIAFEEAIEKLTRDTWQSRGADSALAAVQSYGEDLQALIKQIGYVKENLLFCSEWLWRAKDLLRTCCEKDHQFCDQTPEQQQQYKETYFVGMESTDKVFPAFGEPPVPGKVIDPGKLPDNPADGKGGGGNNGGGNGGGGNGGGSAGGGSGHGASGGGSGGGPSAADTAAGQAKVDAAGRLADPSAASDEAVRAAQSEAQRAAAQRAAEHASGAATGTGSNGAGAGAGGSKGTGSGGTGTGAGTGAGSGGSTGSQQGSQASDAGTGTEMISSLISAISSAITQVSQSVPTLVEALQQLQTQASATAAPDLQALVGQFPDVAQVIAAHPELAPLAEMLGISTPTPPEAPADGATDSAAQSNTSQGSRLFPRASIPGMDQLMPSDFGAESTPAAAPSAGLPSAADDSAWHSGVPSVAAGPSADHEPLVRQTEIPVDGDAGFADSIQRANPAVEA
ncbi:hypothetical protein [Nocardia sp. NPDC058705]|uniref:hypothetical protein n=1 Tax=Nocardia sp. NPDC058705 TaxID=3346609 RepID=UPI003699CB05